MHHVDSVHRVAVARRVETGLLRDSISEICRDWARLHALLLARSSSSYVRDMGAN